MNVLGIETSCDETSAAVVQDGTHVLSNVVFSQASLHAPYGGVVPEIASRNHVGRLPEVIESALAGASLGWCEIDAIAVTHGPGLASSLLVGLSAAKALSLRLNRELVCINHLEAHLYSPFLGSEVPSLRDSCPFLALVVSGGHTCLLRVEELGRCRLLGTTVDDAAGEAFDKGAQLLGLGYPGGPAMERAAGGGNPEAIRFPRGQLRDIPRGSGLSPDLCFSFSGVKTSLAYHIKPISRDRLGGALADIAASYQEAIVDSLADRCRVALEREGLDLLVVCGGVSLNTRLRARLAETASLMDRGIMLAKPEFCVDNAAMVAGLAGYGGGIRGERAWLLDASPDLDIGL